MRIGKFRKAPGDRKRYEVNYADWLNEGELIEAVTMEGNVLEDDFYIDGYMIDVEGKEVVFYVSGGLAGVAYTVTISTQTSLQQVKEDTIEFVVR